MVSRDRQGELLGRVLSDEHLRRRHVERLDDVFADRRTACSHRKNTKVRGIVWEQSNSRCSHAAEQIKAFDGLDLQFDVIAQPIVLYSIRSSTDSGACRALSSHDQGHFLAGSTGLTCFACQPQLLRWPLNPGIDNTPWSRLKYL